MKKSISWLIGIALLCAFFLPGCEDAEEDERTAREWINEGLVYLGQGDGTSAYLAFSKALELEKGNLNAKYGQVLANVLQLRETIRIFTDLLTGQEDSFTSAQTAGGQETLTETDEGLCADACDSFNDCGMLASLSETLNECNLLCPDQYDEQDLECYLAGHPCEIGVNSCFDHPGAGIQKLLDDLLADVSTEMLTNLEQIFEHPEWTFLIPKYNFSLLDLLFQPSLTGENDMAEAHFMNGIANGIAGIFHLLFGLNLDFNPNLMENLALDFSALETLDFSDFGQEEMDAVIGAILQVQNLLDRILKDPVYASFLSLNPEGGTDRMRQASVHIGMAFGEMVQMIDTVEVETDEQWDDAIRYLDQNNNQIWDDDESLLIPGVGQFDKELTFALRDVLLALKINFVDGVPFALNSFNSLLSYADLEWMTLLLDALYLLDMGRIDLAAPLRAPDQEGLRVLLENLSELLDLVVLSLEKIEV